MTPPLTEGKVRRKEVLNAGIHQMKGAVVEIARQLHLSEPTVYRYIKREKGEDK